MQCNVSLITPWGLIPLSIHLNTDKEESECNAHFSVRVVGEWATPNELSFGLNNSPGIQQSRAFSAFIKNLAHDTSITQLNPQNGLTLEI